MDTSELFCKFLLCMINDIVDAAKVIDCLYYIIHVNCFVSNTNGVRFENITRLVVGQPAPLNMIRVIGQINLSAVIDAPLKLAGLLFSERIK